MRKLVGIFFIAAMVAVVTGCDTKTEAEEIAQKFCECSAPAVEMKEKMDEAGNDTEKLQQIMQDYQEEMDGMIECQGQIQQEHGEKLSDPAFEEELRTAIKDECPDIFKILEEEEATM